MSNTDGVDAVPAHPEEFKATYDYRIGRSIRLQGTARMTPAGLVTLAIAVSSILLSTAALVRAKRAR
jgi:hypothetical protein